MDKFFRLGEGPELDRQHVSQNVPERVQRVIFQEHRGLDATDMLEKLALEIYYGKSKLPPMPPQDANESIS